MRSILVSCCLILAAVFLEIGTLSHAALPAQTPTPPATHVQADELLAECGDHYRHSDFQEALDACQSALPLYRQLGDRTKEAMTLGFIGILYEMLSDYQQALIYQQQALSVSREIGDKAWEARMLDGIGGVYSGLSDYQQALTHHQQALSIFREVGDQSGEESALIGIGIVYGALSDYEQALIYFQQALSIAQKIADRVGEADTLANIGTAYLHLSDYEQALIYYQQALPIYRETGKQRGEANTLMNTGIIYEDQGDYQQALDHYQQALSIAVKIGARLVEAKALSNTGNVQSYLSNNKLALDYQQRALAIFQKIGARDEEARTLSAIGRVYHGLSNYEQALAYYQQALAIFQNTGDRYAEAIALRHIGDVYSEWANYEQALTYNQQALAIQQEIGDHEGEGGTLNNIGAVYGNLSDYERALEYFQRALYVARGISNLDGEAVALGNIGMAYESLADHSQALTCLQRALSICREIGDRHDEAAMLSSIGTVYRTLSDYVQALDYYQQALPIRREIGDRAGEAATLNNIGAVYYDLSDYEQALVHYRQALHIFQEIGKRMGEAVVLDNFAEIHETLEQENQALEYALQAVVVVESIYEELGGEALQTAFAASTTDHYHRAIDLLLIQGREVEAFHYAERGRARSFLNLLGNQHINPKDSEAPDLIEREAQLHGDLAALERQLQEEWSKPADHRSQQAIDHITANLEVSRREYEELLIQLPLTNPEYAELISVNPLTLEEAQALLREQAPDTILVSYFVGEEQTVIFVVGSGIFHTEVVSVTRQALRQQADALLAQMKANLMLPDAWQLPAKALYGWLITPVQEHLPPANTDAPPRLGIIPHDLLHYLPFGLLYDGERTLLDGYTLFYAPSVSSLPFIFEKRHSQADTLLALANPDAPGGQRLSYVVEEAQAVATLYGTQPITGTEATERRFKIQAGEYNLVHLAAHGEYSPQSPLFSAILLQPDESEDGRLETHEVFNLDLPQTDLVVLSACETHLGELSSGDELVGLERAFLRAGSPSLLTTLWPVDDEATAELMEQFYTHLRAGVPKAEALRLAQMETRKEHPEPYYWAGFVLVGDYGEGPASPGERWKQYRWLLWVGVGLIVTLSGAATLWWWRKMRVNQS